MVPILSSLIAGQGAKPTRRRAILLSLVYVLAMALTYTVAGVLAALLGQNIQAWFQNPWVIAVFSGMFVLLALSMFGLYDLQLPVYLQHPLGGVEQPPARRSVRRGSDHGLPVGADRRTLRGSAADRCADFHRRHR